MLPNSKKQLLCEKGKAQKVQVPEQLNGLKYGQEIFIT